MLICVSCLNDKNSDNESEEGTIVFTKKNHNDSVGPTEEYTCTVLDEGILELVDYSDEMAYLSGHVRKVAPLGDPMEITLRGYELSVRKHDAEMIEVEEQ